MIDLEREHLERDPAWRAVLEAYRTLQAEIAAQQPESDGWIARIRDVDGVPPEELPILHGRLIALGLLRFDLAGRTEGLRYQVSPAGRQLLNQEEANPDSAADTDDESNETDEEDGATASANGREIEVASETAEISDEE